MQSSPRLVLYSDQQLPQNPLMDSRLMQMINKRNPRIGYVPSAPDPDRVWFDRKRQYYSLLEADLSFYLDPDNDDLANAISLLLSCDAIHLSGGNTFSFLRWLKERSILPILRSYALGGGVLIGESAGAILMTPSVDSSSLCGDSPDPSLTDTSALGLVSFHFWPHSTYNAPMTLEQKVFATEIPRLFACTDGSGIVIEGESIECFGQVQEFCHGRQV